MTTHGKSKTRIYATWARMLKRCRYSKDPMFKYYGGRGIKVCKRWYKFENFLEDMGLPPTFSHSLDRIDSNKNYKLSNCRWLTHVEQCRNRRNNISLTYKGKTQCLKAWAEEVKLSYSALQARRKLGWSVKKMLTTPVVLGRNQFT